MIFAAHPVCAAFLDGNRLVKYIETCDKFRNGDITEENYYESLNLATASEVVNINIPRLSAGKPKGIRVVPQSTEGFHEHYVREENEQGQQYQTQQQLQFMAPKLQTE